MWASSDDLRSKDCIEYYLSNIGDAKAFFSSYDNIDWSNNKKSFPIKVPLLSGEANNRDDICAFLNHACSVMIYGLFRTRELKYIFLVAIDWAIEWGDCLTIVTFMCRFGYKTQVSDSKFSAGYFIKYKVKPVNQKYLNPFPFVMKLLSISLVPFDSKKLLLSLKLATIFSKISLVHFVKNIFQKTSIEGYWFRTVR